MRITEGQLRRIIREMLTLEATLADVIPDDQIDAVLAPHPDIAQDIWSTAGIYYGGNKETVKRRRDLKRLWNQHADHKYFDDPSKIFVRHYLGMFSGKRSVADYFPHGSSTSGRIPGIHIANRNELSCLASVSPDEPSGIEVMQADLSFFTFKKYRMTFASWQDIGSERLSTADPTHTQKYKGSGFPKRPSPQTLPDNLPIDEEGVREFKELDEVIIDNWIIDTLYIADSMDAQDSMREIKLAEDLGLKWKWKWESRS